MKLLPLLLILTTTVHSQCPPGQVWMPSLKTSSFEIIADSCMDKALADQLWRTFYRNLCGESESEYAGIYWRSIERTFKDSCITIEYYFKRTPQGLVPLSKCLYYYEQKRYNMVMQSNGIRKKIYLCGHVHVTKPL